jgi:nitroreductase
MVELSRVSAGAGPAGRSVGAWVDGLVAERPEPAGDGSPPDRADLIRILEAATTVPDHGGLRPWRFAVIAGTGRDAVGEALVAGLRHQRGDDPPEAALVKMRGKLSAAPCAVMVVASPDPSSNVPEWEQRASASCTGYAMVLAAVGLGYGAVWKSASVLGTDPVRALFELTEHERLLGWVNLGTPAPRHPKKAASGPVGLDRIVSVIGEDGPRPFLEVDPR